MAEKLRIFVSATNDLEDERALIGQTLADLPVQVPAEIRRTPAEGVSYETMFELIANVDRVYFLLGRDITAPAGLEWHLAMQLERSVVPLRLACSRTPAGQEFLRIAGFAPWKVFRNRRHLTRLVALDLVDLLLHPENRYGLTLPEVEALTLRRQQIQEGLVTEFQEPGGAEGGGVLLGQEMDDEMGG